MDEADNVCCQVLIDADVGGVEDGDRVEDDGVDAGPLLEDHGGQAKAKRIPNRLIPQLRKEGKGNSRENSLNRLHDSGSR